MCAPFRKIQYSIWAMLLGIVSSSWAQLFEIVVVSDEIEISLEGYYQIFVKAVNARNEVVSEVNFNFYSSALQILKVDKKSLIMPLKPDEGNVIIIGRLEGIKEYQRLNLSVNMRHSERKDLKIFNLPVEIFEDKRIGIKVQLMRALNNEISNSDINFESSDASFASVDNIGNITAHQKGMSNRYIVNSKLNILFHYLDKFYPKSIF